LIKSAFLCSCLSSVAITPQIPDIPSEESLYERGLVITESANAPRDGVLQHQAPGEFLALSTYGYRKTIIDAFLSASASMVPTAV
jgi:hypothetical protein